MSTDQRKREAEDDGSRGVATLVKGMSILFVLGIYMIILLKILILE